MGRPSWDGRPNRLNTCVFVYRIITKPSFLTGYSRGGLRFLYSSSRINPETNSPQSSLVIARLF